MFLLVWIYIDGPWSWIVRPKKGNVDNGMPGILDLDY
jgi:hypothetical protein